MFFSRPIQWYHSHVDPIWPEGNFQGFSKILLQTGYCIGDLRTFTVGQENTSDHLTRLRVREWGSLNSDDWIKGLALCLLCAPERVL